MDINSINLENRLSIIEASAGTGKSFTLAHLVLRNIFENKINPENILLLSFTKNTCNELRFKINERIDKVEKYILNNEGDKIDKTLFNWYNTVKQNSINYEELINNIGNIKADINKVTITTFHGLCKK